VREGEIVIADEAGILILPPEHKDVIVRKVAEIRLPRIAR
jgi:regulator of RNase E activity RraA